MPYEKTKRTRKRARSKARALHVANIPRVRIVTPIVIQSPDLFAACQAACHRAALNATPSAAHG